MKFLKIRNKNYLKTYIKNEYRYLILKYLISSKNIPIQFRFKCSLLLSKYKIFRTKYRRHCFLTARMRSNIRFFNLSRIKIRDLAANNALPFVEKYSW
jgi:ribosomal protein S14